MNKETINGRIKKIWERDRGRKENYSEKHIYTFDQWRRDELSTPSARPGLPECPRGGRKGPITHALLRSQEQAPHPGIGPRFSLYPQVLELCPAHNGIQTYLLYEAGFSHKINIKNSISGSMQHFLLLVIKSPGLAKLSFLYVLREALPETAHPGQAP